jgi:hypothetical protein
MESTKTIQCRKCESTNVSCTYETGISSLIWGLIMIVFGAFFILLAIMNWGDTENTQGRYLVPFVGFSLLSYGIPKTYKFAIRKKRSFHYRCDNCSYTWIRPSGEGNVEVIEPMIKS